MVVVIAVTAVAIIAIIVRTTIIITIIDTIMIIINTAANTAANEEIVSMTEAGGVFSPFLAARFITFFVSAKVLGVYLELIVYCLRFR